MTIASVFILIILILLIFWILAVRCRKDHPLLALLSEYRYAHRGLHNAERPENSLPAFREAINSGYGAELDVHLTADNHLAVMHDSSTARMCGTDLMIESSTWAELQELRLSGTEEHIPSLEDVLALFAHSSPLVIELKTANNNADALCTRVFDVLDRYPGAFCIESFDPRVLRWLKKNRPDICRGQLATKFAKGEAGLSWPMRFAMTHLLMNFLTVPDFIAYDHTTRRKTASLNICRGVWGVQEFSWTIRSKDAMEKMEQLGSLIIFEKFRP